MSAITELPPGWACFTWPTSWQPISPAVPMVGTTEGRVPQQFCLAVHAPDMDSPGGAVIFTYEAQESGVTLAHITSIGEDVTAHLGPVLALRSPQQWQDVAVTQIAAFQGAEAAIQATVGRRNYKVTGSHLKEVSTVYRQALAEGKPPTRAVQTEFSSSHSTAARWVGHARRAGLLPPANKGAAA